MTNQDKDQLLLDLINKFAKHEANLSELIEFGVMFIVNAAKLSGFPEEKAEVVIDETEYLLREHLKSALNKGGTI